jgi:hypothetical protein
MTALPTVIFAIALVVVLAVVSVQEIKERRAINKRMKLSRDVYDKEMGRNEDN